MTEWVDVKQREPTNAEYTFGHVIVALDDGTVNRGYKEPYTDGWASRGSVGTVTHWMRFPPPPHVCPDKRWVPVKERVPTKEDYGAHGFVISTFEDGTVFASWKHSYDDGWLYETPRNRVTHWMRFPDAPKGETGE